MEAILVANRKGGTGKTLIATTLASALAADGARVALADADRQGSSLAWLARRPASVPAITGLDWKKTGDIGETPKKCDWLVIDAPGALRGDRAEALIAEARAVITPLQPSIFDMDSTRAFIDEIEEIKRVRKGKVPVHLIANRLKTGSRAAAEIESFFAELGRAPAARITERSAYGDLAREGLGLWDRRSWSLRPLRAQWQPLLDTIRG